MSQDIMKKRLTSTSLRHGEGAHTVLLRMAHDEARAQRIRALKKRHVDVKWREIADYVGVSERSALAWARTGGISRPNVKKLADFFQQIVGDQTVTADWIWFGDDAVPDPLDTFNSASRAEDKVLQRLAVLEAKIDRLLDRGDEGNRRRAS